jgi:ATP-dependent Lhr-like helicase
MLALARLQTLAPGLRRVGLSATVEDPPALARWLARHPDPCAILMADPGPDPDIAMLTTGTPPWSGRRRALCDPRVLEEVRRHRTTLIFHNTRAQAEIFFHNLWQANDDSLPIGIHHGSLAREAARIGRGGDGGRRSARPSSAPARSIWGSTGAMWIW